MTISSYIAQSPATAPPASTGITQTTALVIAGLTVLGVVFTSAVNNAISKRALKAAEWQWGQDAERIERHRQEDQEVVLQAQQREVRRDLYVRAVAYVRGAEVLDQDQETLRHRRAASDAPYDPHGPITAPALEAMELEQESRRLAEAEAIAYRESELLDGEMALTAPFSVLKAFRTLITTPSSKRTTEYGLFIEMARKDLGVLEDEDLHPLER